MPEGKVVKDPNEVDLTDKGLMQARLIDKNTKNIHFERILSSVYPELFKLGPIWRKEEI